MRELTAPLRWRDGVLHLLDQRQLPNRVVVERHVDAASVAVAIRELRVRGAPAIGIAAAYALAMAWRTEADMAGAAAELRAPQQ